jgi:hypothetical protein
MKSYGLLGIFLTGLLLVGCVEPHWRYGGESASGWQLLGEREADFQRDQDRIDVGRREGTYREIRIAVRGAPVEINRIVVTFADGKTFSPSIRERFDQNSSSREIDLPGDRRSIRSVDFTYRSPDRRQGKATVVLYAR